MSIFETVRDILGFKRGGVVSRRPYITRKAKKIAKVMREFKARKLKSNNRIVRKRKQAIAIALSEAKKV